MSAIEKDIAGLSREIDTLTAQANEMLETIKTSKEKLAQLKEAADNEGMYSFLGSVIIADYRMIALKSNWQETAPITNALETLIKLRQCAGSEPVNNRVQWFIFADTSCGQVTDLEILKFSVDRKCALMSPPFKTKAHAEKAIAEVGRDAVVRMFNVLNMAKLK